MTLEEVNELHSEIFYQFTGSELYYEWVEIHHHFETPFYYISYATSAISALEIWAQSLDDRNQAVCPPTTRSPSSRRISNTAML